MNKTLQIIYTPKGKADEYARSSRYPDDPPIAANLYAGCTHGCTYCYVPGVLRQSREEFHACAVPKEKALKRFEHDCALLQARGNKAPIFLSFTTDPYQEAEREYRLTRQAIEIAHFHKQRVNILTKADLLPREDLDSLIPGPGGDIFGITLTTLDPDIALKWEPKAGHPSLRLNTLAEAHRQGIETRISFEPVIDPEQVLDMIPLVRPHADLIQVGKWNYDPRAKEIDWKAFAHEVLGLLSRMDGAYYIKDDLRKYLEG